MFGILRQAVSDQAETEQEWKNHMNRDKTVLKPCVKSCIPFENIPKQYIKITHQ